MTAPPILLTFRPDQAELDRVLALVAPRKAGRGRTSLGHRLSRIDFVRHDAELWVPVRLAIGGVDLLQCPGHRHPLAETIGTHAPTWLEEGHRPACPWQWLPVIDVATRPLWMIRGARNGSRSAYGDDLFPSPVLTFEGIGGEVLRVTAGVRAAEAPAEELLPVWYRFGDDVRGWLMAEVPDLADHRAIGKWLTDGPSHARW